MKLLFVIDVQNGFVSNRTQDVIPKILTLMDAFQEDLIISTKFINTENSGFTNIMHWDRLKKAPETDLYVGIGVRSSIVIEKTTYSACTPEVCNIIHKYGIKEAYISGIDTDCCVLKTAIDLFEMDVRPIVLTSYCASNGGVESHNAAIKVLERTIGERQLCADTVAQIIKNADD